MSDASPSPSRALTLARQQWERGDWEGLLAWDQPELEKHPDRGELLLLCGAAQFQLGHQPEARALSKRAQKWGATHSQLLRYLFSTPASDRKCRIQPTFKVSTLITHNLGDAWAGNIINTVIFRHHGILTHGKTQYTAFYVDTHTLRLVQRDLATDTLITYDLLGEYNLRDAHNSISLGVDRQGHLHISYDHHATQLRYRRSSNPSDITAWTDELPMTGAHEEKVTYPTFILPHQGFPLTFLYRDGVHDKGTARLKTFDEATQTWTNQPQAILSGSEQKPWTSNAYWNHPAVGSDGSLHLSFVWRTHTLGEEQRINNINIGYACSHDNGLTWQTSQKRPYKLPITQVNAETIHPISPGSNLINQTSMALDSSNRPHIVFYADDPDGIPQYQHLWFDGKLWRHQIVSNRTQAFNLQGGGTLQIPISRPEIVIDRQDNVFIITRGDHTQNRLAATLLVAPHYTYQPHNIQILSDEDIGFAEPVIDRERWERDGVLTLLVQHNEQPDHDVNHLDAGSPVKLIDLQVKCSSISSDLMEKASVHGKKSTRSEKAIDFMLVASVEI